MNRTLATQTILCPICRAPNRGDALFCQQCGNDVLLDNIYRITKVVKEGGQGIVYKGIDETGAEYAVKEMHDRFATAAEREEGIERFLEEGSLLSKLRHPAIPRVYRSFIDEGRYYLSMEFIYGGDLEDIVKGDSAIPEAKVLGWADQLCDVLHYMHSQGLVYRDMKPSNVMLTRDGAVKVIDFGIAKLLQPGQRNTMIGTPGYAPPEQYQGLASAQSDIYALAATLHHLLTGRDPRDHPPFSFPPAIEVNRRVSSQTSQVLEKALSMDEKSRFQTIAAFRSALPIPQGERHPTLPFDPPRPPQPATRRVDEPQPRRQPRQQPPAQPRQQPQVRSIPVPVQPSRVPVPAPPLVASPVAPAQPQRRRGGALRRVFMTLVLLAGLGGLAAGTYPAQARALFEELQRAIAGASQPAPAPVPQPDTTAPDTSNQPPAQNYDIQPSQLEIKTQVAENASRAEIVQALRDEYLKQAQAQHPGAQVTGGQPTVIGDYQLGAVANGQQEVTATMNGSIAVPRQ